MREASPALIAYLATKPKCWSADLFTFTLLNGAVVRLTSFDQTVVCSGFVFISGKGTPLVQRNKWEMQNTIQVPEMEIKLFADNVMAMSGQPVKQLIHNGGFDGATVKLERVFMPTIGDCSMGSVTLFSGNMSKITLSAGGATLTVRASTVIFNQYMPRNTYQTTCVHTLYDSGCTLLASDFTSDNEMILGGDRTTIYSAALSFGTIANFTLGTLLVTSGAATGSLRTILSAVEDETGFRFGLAYPLYADMTPGDTFTTTYGCARTQGVCLNVFDNIANFRGFPYVPDASIAY